MSLLVIHEFLGLFVNTLNAHGNCSFCNSENLQQTIQMQLSIIAIYLISSLDF